MKTLILSIIMLLGFSGISQTYTVEVIQSPYVSLEGGQPLVQETWSDPVFSVPIGFSFPFFDEFIDTLYSQDFFAGGYVSSSLEYADTDIIDFFSTDLIDRGYESDSLLSPIVYKTTGSIGQRVFTLEFMNAGFWSGEVSQGIYTDYINIQIRLEEETGDIEVHIGPYSVQNPELNFEGLTGPTIGLVEGFNFEDGSINGEILIIAGDPLNPDVITDFSPGYLEWPIPENTVYVFSRVATSTETSTVGRTAQFYFPNPATDVILLNQKYYGTITSPVQIFNSLGRNLATIHDINSIDVDNLATGLYYLKFQTTNGSAVQKLSINR